MEIAIGIIVVGAAILLIIVGVKAWERKQKRKAEKEEADRQAVHSARTRAALAMGSMGSTVGSSAGTLGQSRRLRSSGGVAPQTAQPVVVQQSSGIDPLMAGLIGYGLAGGFASHSNASPGNVASSPLESCKPEEDRSYTPSSDSGSSYSSDSGSSYDSGSSGGGDSGGSSGGGGD